MPSIVQPSFRSTSQKACSNSFPKVTMKKRLENPSAKISKRIRKKKKRIKKTKPLRTFKFYVFPFKVRNSFVESNILTLFPRNLTLGIEEFLGQKNTMRETSRLSSPRLVSVLTAFPSLPPLPSRPSIFQSSCRIHFPPFLLLLLLFGSSPPFFAPANAISICRWYSVAASWFHGNPRTNEADGWANALSITRTRESLPGVNVHTPLFPIECL